MQVNDPFTTYDQPADVRLQAETYNGRTRFQIGEIIRLKLSFTSSAPKKYQINMAEYDRSGRKNYEDFTLAGSGGSAAEEDRSISRELSEFLASRTMKLSLTMN